MPTQPSKPVAVARARVAAAIRDGRDPAEIAERRQDLEAAKLEDRVRKIVDGWPPLTPAQRDRLALLLSPAGGTDGQGT